MRQHLKGRLKYRRMELSLGVGSKPIPSSNGQYHITQNEFLTARTSLLYLRAMFRRASPASATRKADDTSAIRHHLI